MAWNVAAPPQTDGEPPRPKRRRGGLLALALLAPVVSGCETLERVDYFDRIFDPALRQQPPVSALDLLRGAAPRPPAPGWGTQLPPVAAAEPLRGPADHPPPTDPSPQPPRVVAMEPVRSPADDHPPVAERSPQQGPVRAAEARPSPAPQSAADPEARTRLLVRQNPWLTRFWMELTPAQRARVERQLQRGDVRLASGQPEPAAVWDPMGLSDRANLIFGRGASPDRPAPAEGRGSPALAADNS